MRAFADDPPVEREVADLLRAADQTVATAESCTGGLAGALLASVPGASDVFDRTYATYSYEAKLETGVRRETIDAHGAVSDPVAREMARAIRDLAGVDWGVATSGIAGPTGGTEEAPVGTVFVGVAHAAEWGTGESYATVEHREFEGERADVIERIARAALDALATELRARAADQ